MSIKIGNIDVSYFKVGGDDVSIYIGSEKLYPEEPTFEGKYMLTLSDSSTVSAECDSTSSITQAEISTYSSTLTTAEIGNCVTSIGQQAFRNCSSLTSITIPDSVTSINSYAFNYCSSLTSIDIPSGVTTIGDYAFDGCSSLTSITVDSNNTVYDSRNNCNAIIETSTNKLIQGCISTVIPSSVTSIGNYAFGGCDSLTSMTIPNSVTSIGEGAFNGCNGLTSIDIPSGVTSIGDFIFSSCSSLTSVTISDSITTISSAAFQGCSSLTSITIPDSVTSINSYAFNYCSSLTSIDIPSGVTSINSQAFNGCSSLTSVTVDSNNTVYDSRNNCNAIIETSTNTLVQGCNSTVIPNSVTSIGGDAFAYCRSLTSMAIPDSVTSIGGNAFQGCSSLTSITIPNSVTSIGNYVFSSCSSLTSIDIPSGVTSIGSQTFYYCTSLTSVDIPSGVTSISSNAFRNCSGLTSVTVNATTPPTLGIRAFDGSTCPIYVPSGSVNTYKSASGWSTYASRIQAIPHDYSQDYLTFVVDGSGAIVWKQVGTGSTKTISYSKDSGSSWTSISSTTGGTSINVSDGDIVWFKGTETAYAVDNKNYSAFVSSGTGYIEYTIEGNIMSLLYGDNFVGQTALTEDFTFCSLFKNNNKIYDAENLILPSTTLRESCYRAMFSNCSLGTGTLPKLPATTLAPYCYYFMFENNRRLTRVPTNYLPVTSLSGADNCYYAMFSGCDFLETVPELPATILSEACYKQMFKGCSRLATAPQLPATTLTTDCYNTMFSGCTLLSAITCLATDISASNCTTNWLKGVAANGAFTKAASMNDWSTGVNGIPSGWTVTDYT